MRPAGPGNKTCSAQIDARAGKSIAFPALVYLSQTTEMFKTTDKPYPVADKMDEKQ
jgi:hypothetical protein